MNMTSTKQKRSVASEGPGDLQARRQRHHQENKIVGINVPDIGSSKAYRRYAGPAGSHEREDGKSSPSNNAAQTQDFVMIPVASPDGRETILLQSVPLSQPQTAASKDIHVSDEAEFNLPSGSITPEAYFTHEWTSREDPPHVCYCSAKDRPHKCHCQPINGIQYHFFEKPPGYGAGAQAVEKMVNAVQKTPAAIKGKITGFFAGRQARKQEARRKALKKTISSPKDVVKMEEIGQHFRHRPECRQVEPKRRRLQKQRKSSEIKEKSKGSLKRNLSERITKMTDFLHPNSASLSTTKPLLRLRHAAGNASELSFTCIGVDSNQSEPQPPFARSDVVPNLPETQPEPEPQVEMCAVCDLAPSQVYNGELTHLYSQLCEGCTSEYGEQAAMKTDVNRAEETISTDDHSQTKMDARRQKHIAKAMRKLEGRSRKAQPTTESISKEEEENQILSGTTFSPSEEKEFSTRPTIEHTQGGKGEESSSHSKTIYRAYRSFQAYSSAFTSTEASASKAESKEEQSDILPRTTYQPHRSFHNDVSALVATESEEATESKPEESTASSEASYQTCRSAYTTTQTSGSKPSNPEGSDDESYILPASLYIANPRDSQPPEVQRTRRSFDRQHRGSDGLPRGARPSWAPAPMPVRRPPSTNTSTDSPYSPDDDSEPALTPVHRPPSINTSTCTPDSPEFSPTPPSFYNNNNNQYHDEAALDAAIAATQAEAEDCLRNRLPTYRISPLQFEREIWEREAAERRQREEERSQLRRIPTLGFERERRAAAAAARAATAAAAAAAAGVGERQRLLDDDQWSFFSFDAVPNVASGQEESQEKGPDPFERIGWAE
ncbi:MAG: hypothetical protein M1816_001062 [Peltula sp. TS41687]|nr:MAG: hypothetical protein M1816_001062 [Peltula sp. TS41687]